ADAADARATGATRQLRAPVPRQRRECVPVTAARAAAGHAARRARRPAARARDRRRVSTGDRAAEPLLPGDLARAIRRVHLVRRDRGGAPTLGRSAAPRGAATPARAMRTAHELMASFGERTGITGARPQRRYLWTDAFAVCNFLGLGQADLARSTIRHVHHELGRHRADDPRRGWISGLSEIDGEAHPTLGGLRIGKPLPERGPADQIDEQLEWERDGQYFHYLTKWMHALDQAARITRDDRLATWARELADTAHRRFVHGPHASRRMSWKMSIDLMRPQ